MSRNNIDHTLRDNQTSYEDNSYYLPKGSKNSHRLLESRGQNQRTSDDLTIQFEMKFDSIKNYVDSVTSAVNQHASLLNKLRGEINLRVVEKNLSETINKFADCITVKDLDPSFMITAVNENIDSKDDDASFKSAVTNFCNKLETIGSGFSKVNKIGQTVTGRMQEIENSLGKKVSTGDVKEKVKKAKTKIRGEIENNNKKLDENLKAIEKRYLEKYENLEKRLNRMDQNMNEGYREQNQDGMIKKADFSILTQEIEDKIMKEVNLVILQNKESKDQENSDLRITLKTIEEKTNKHISDVKKALEEANASFAKKTETLKQEDIEKEINKHLSKSMKVFGEPFEESCNKLKQQVEAIKKSIENMECSKMNSARNNVNSEKLAEIEQATAKSQLDIDSLNEKLNEFAKSLKEKPSLSLSETYAQTRSKSEKFDVGDISDFMQAEEEKHKKMSKTIEDLEQKVDKVNQNFDRKAAKLKKEFDLDSLIKQFKSKADEGYVQKTFENFEAKIGGLSESFVLLKREIDQMARGNYNSAKPNDNAFISIKSALPKACLSCGNNGPLQQINNSFGARKPEKPHLREKDSSIDRPSTASHNLKMKIITGSTTITNMNMTSTQGFGITPLRVSATRPDSLK